MWFPVMKTVIFKTISLQTLGTTTTPAVGFSVPVDASNTYVDFRIGNKVYVKLKNQYTDINYGSLRIGGIYVNSYNEGAVGRLSQNDYKNVLHASCTTVGGRFGAAPYDSRCSF
jgi:hypothetical protein